MNDFKCYKDSANSTVLSCIENTCKRFALATAAANAGPPIFYTEFSSSRKSQKSGLDADTIQRSSRKVSYDWKADYRYHQRIVAQVEALEYVKDRSGKKPIADEFLRMCQDREYASGKIFGNLGKSLLREKK